VSDQNPKRGRPPLTRDALPPSSWVPPAVAANHIGTSQASLWRGVSSGRITAPSYPSEKSPRFNLRTLDSDMERARAKPSEGEAGRRAAKLTEARQQARAKRADDTAT
jgi:hypothetical protein